MLFETFEEKVKAMLAEKADMEREYSERVNAVSKELKELKEEHQTALDSGDSEAYVFLSGKIAVTEAKLKRTIENKPELRFDKNFMQQLNSDLAKLYFEAMDEKAVELNNLAMRIYAISNGELSDVYNRYHEVHRLLQQLTDVKLPAHGCSYPDLVNLERVCEKVIEPSLTKSSAMMGGRDTIRGRVLPLIHTDDYEKEWKSSIFGW